jgi:hypothetical protein
MRHIQVDMAHLMIQLPDHRDLLRRLEPVCGPARIQEIGRNAGRPAARLAGIHRLAAENLVIRFLQRVFRELGQIGIVEVRNPEGRLLAGVVGHIGMRGIAGDQRRAARQGDPVGTDGDPAGIARGEVGRTRAFLRRDLRQGRRERGAGAEQAGQEDGGQLP